MDNVMLGLMLVIWMCVVTNIGGKIVCRTNIGGKNNNNDSEDNNDSKFERKKIKMHDDKNRCM